MLGQHPREVGHTRASLATALLERRHRVGVNGGRLHLTRLRIDAPADWRDSADTWKRSGQHKEGVHTLADCAQRGFGPAVVSSHGKAAPIRRSKGPSASHRARCRRRGGTVRVRCDEADSCAVRPARSGGWVEARRGGQRRAPCRTRFRGAFVTARPVSVLLAKPPRCERPFFSKGTLNSRFELYYRIKSKSNHTPRRASPHRIR